LISRAQERETLRERERAQTFRLSVEGNLVLGSEAAHEIEILLDERREMS